MVKHVLDPNGSTLTVETRATGVLKSFAHDRSFIAPIPFTQLPVESLDGFELDVDLSIDAGTFDALGDDLSSGDYKLLMRNLQGAKVLDTKHHPAIRIRGRRPPGWSRCRTPSPTGELQARAS